MSRDRMRNTVSDLPTNEQVRFRTIELLSDGWYVLKRCTFDYHRQDGTWQEMQREVCERGDSSVVLVYSRMRGSVVLTRQFRLPVFLNGQDGGMVIEAPGGLLGTQTAKEAALSEVHEETGFLLLRLKEVFSAYMSPAVLTERLHFFLGELDSDHHRSLSGGIASEGEDIEIVEIKFDEALEMIEKGEIQDAKTILLLYYAKLKGLFS